MLSIEHVNVNRKPILSKKQVNIMGQFYFAVSFDSVCKDTNVIEEQEWRKKV